MATLTHAQTQRSANRDLIRLYQLQIKQLNRTVGKLQSEMEKKEKARQKRHDRLARKKQKLERELRIMWWTSWIQTMVIVSSMVWMYREGMTGKSLWAFWGLVIVVVGCVGWKFWGRYQSGGWGQSK